MKESFDQQELEILRVVLKQLKIEKRTGDLGILHGAKRFTSTHICLRKNELKLLDGIATKAGLSTGLDRVNS